MQQEHDLLDTLINHMQLKNDAALARALQVAPPVISKIRSGRLPVGASFIIRAHLASGMSVKSLLALSGGSEAWNIKEAA